jgi:hypothetical protein
MILLGVSGGGMRAALWSFSSLSMLDSITNGQFFKNTFLITGASGGIVGASYFRELYLRKYKGEKLDLSANQHIRSISSDILNPILFTLIVHDLFIRHSRIEVNGRKYLKGRGYEFEKQLNINTGGVLNKKLTDYAADEQEGIIPTLIMSPTIVHGAKKLYIGAQSVSYLNVLNPHDRNISGIDFLRFFETRSSEDFNYLTALRMNATFPYITPNVSLPTEPRVEIMDAGISDNFGIADAVQFAYIFKEWIEENTSGIIVLSVRDSRELTDIEGVERQSMLQKFFNPIKSIYNNWWGLQDINNQMRIEHARSWLRVPVHEVNIEYASSDYDAPLVAREGTESQGSRRASLNWHLTEREKQNIVRDVHSKENIHSSYELMRLLKTSTP